MHLFPGRVEFVAPEGCEFDYRVTVSVETVDGGRGRAVVDEIAAIRRPGGADLGRRRLAAEPLGWIKDQAIVCMTIPADGPLEEDWILDTNSVAALQTGARRRQRPSPTDREVELELVRQAHDAALERGVPMRRHIAERLKAKGWPHSDAQVKKLLRECRDQGLIPPRGRGRPSRVYRA